MAAAADRIEAKRLVPSDRNWRLKNYYMLVERQRHAASIDAAEAAAGELELSREKNEDGDDNEEEEEGCCWAGGSSEWGEDDEAAAAAAAAVETKSQDIPTIPEEPSCTVSTVDLRLRQEEEGVVCTARGSLVKAGCLLASSPVTVLFRHEEEQRTVYALVYDAFRYRSVFNQALQDTSFFMIFPQLRPECMLVHLLLCQLYMRRFNSREPPWPSGCELTALWHSTGMSQVEDALWEVRVRLAAALARLRIKSNALQLEHLLPVSLQDKSGQRDEHPAAVWVNTFKIKLEEVVRLLESSGLTLQGPGLQDVSLIKVHPGTLQPRCFALDPRCPGMLLYHPALRADLANSELVRGHFVVLQGRAFCLGPAMFCRVLEELVLTGTVVQCHASSPRTTAYLATLIAASHEIHSLITFGAGSRKAEYEAYLARLGVNNVRVRAERFADLSPDSPLLEGVVAVLALPPNTYSGVQDPVELACNNGGDLRVLEELTFAAESDSEAARMRHAVLQQEQRDTLRMALAAPQIQFVLFESHSSTAVETTELLVTSVLEANSAARERQSHAGARACSALTDQDEHADAQSTADSTCLEPPQQQPPSHPRTPSAVTIPPTDLFEIAPLEFKVAKEGDEAVDPCPALQEDGCFLALLRRQEITRLDAQYMIQIAEARGLFGGSAKKSSPSATSRRTPRRKPDLSLMLGQGPGGRKKDRGGSSTGGYIEMERIAAPTVASLLRQSVPSSSSSGSSPISCLDCPKHARAVEPPPDICSRYRSARRQDARRWWSETATRVLALTRIQSEQLPRFRLRRTLISGAAGSCYREPYPLSVRCLEFSETEEDVPIDFNI